MRKARKVREVQNRNLLLLCIEESNQELEMRNQEFNKREGTGVVPC